MTEKKLDWDKPIETVSGKPAKVVSRDFKSKGRGFDVVVQIEEDYESRLYFYLQDGRPIYAAGPLLRNKPRKVTKWYNLYADRPGGGYWKAEQEAKDLSHGNEARTYIETRSIEIEEPE
jgi:hypothetical protein